MALTGHDRRRRIARRRLIAAAVALTGALAAAVAVLPVRSDGGSRDDAGRPPAAVTSSAGPAPSTQPHPAPAGTTVLPAPAHVVNGVPMGYPHTSLGAVSSAAHYYEALDLLDPEAARRQAETAAQPGFSTAMGLQAQAAARRVRTAFGLPADGTSDNADYVAQQARAFRIATSTPDQVKVWLLMDTSTSDKGVTGQRTSVQGAVLVWADGDWRMAVLQQMGTAPATVPPDTQQARQQGWRALAYAK